MAPKQGDVLQRAYGFFFILLVFVTSVSCIFRYSRDDLLSLRPIDSGLFQSVFCGSSFSRYSDNFLSEASTPSFTNNGDQQQQNGHGRPKSKRKRGKRGGLLVKSRRNNHAKCPPLPTMMLSNVNRLYNKTDELFSRLQNQHDFKNSHVLCFTETWLNDNHPDNLVTPPGYSLHRLDRDLVTTGKKDGGGVCIMVQNKWCSDVKIIAKGCTPNIEYLSIKCRPFYLPREFSSVSLTAVYIHPKADTKDALSSLSKTINETENKHPDTLSIITGDFNQSNLSTVMPNFHQTVHCPTRRNKTLDHCYCKIKKTLTKLSNDRA